MVVKRAKQKGISLGYCDTRTGQRVYPPPPVSQMTDLLPEHQSLQHTPALYPSGSSDEDVSVKVTCFPPLGQATQVARQQSSVRFIVLLETSSPSLVAHEDGPDPEFSPQVCLWHNHGGHYDWCELPLKPTTAYRDLMVLNRPIDRSVTRSWFMAELPGLPKHAQVVNFTVKFCVASSKGWKWVKDTSGMEDGALHYQGMDYQKHSSHSLDYFFSGMSPDIEVQSEQPETDDTYLYSLKCHISPAQGLTSGYQQHQLGKVKNATSWFALVRLWSPWLAPRHGKGKLELDKEAVLLSFLREDGMNVVVLALSGVEDMVTTLIHDEDGNIIAKGRNDRVTAGIGRVFVAVADSFDIANCAVMYHARKIVGSYSTHSLDSAAKAAQDETWLEEWYDGLTYCTWNGIGQDLTADKIYNALDSLASSGISVTNLIIDDNWQSLSAGETQFKRAWREFEADPVGFPEGLKETTRKIRAKHPSIHHIAVWHALLGYWGGVDPKSFIGENYNLVEVEKEPGVAGGKFHVVAAEDAKRLYNDFYRFLSSVGVDSVKTDAQFFLDMLLNAPTRREMMTEYQDAWTIAHLRHFSSRAISCMSQTPQILFHSQMPMNKPRLLVRNSDDFFPEVPASHPWHVFCNAHNSLLTQHLNVLPDWDMFQTASKNETYRYWASFHAAARAVSGGPIYITDEPGQHNIELIRQMTAQTTRGKTVILRPHRPGRAMDIYNSYNAQALLKIGTYAGSSRKGSGILGVFNVSDRSVSEFVHLTSLCGTEVGEYVVSSFRFGKVSRAMTREGKEAIVGVQLDQAGWDILTAYPLQHFTVHHKSIAVAIMGLVDKMTGVAAMTNYDLYVEQNGRLRIWVSLKAMGVLGLYISDLEARSIEDSLMIMIYGKPIPFHCVGVSHRCGKVLEINVERAWREGKFESGWNNEVSLEMFLN
ncbi:MAG: glycoside hydrolase family 36 protein [Acidomyces sp. 'richmondensis']|nr:MAG: glycoside hydrolase family 36 protein [Acidomyces sp. 'richmondensis']